MHTENVATVLTSKFWQKVCSSTNCYKIVLRFAAFFSRKGKEFLKQLSELEKKIKTLEVAGLWNVPCKDMLILQVNALKWVYCKMFTAYIKE